jgi:hypothetical protein
MYFGGVYIIAKTIKILMMADISCLLKLPETSSFPKVAL